MSKEKNSILPCGCLSKVRQNLSKANPGVTKIKFPLDNLITSEGSTVVIYCDVSWKDQDSPDSSGVGISYCPFCGKKIKK
ncbi:MAG: hypothetical protein WCY49_07380 [Anaerovoracaceae bacterium]